MIIYHALSTFRCEVSRYHHAYSVKINLPAQQYNTVIQHKVECILPKTKSELDHLAIKILLEQEFRIKLP